MSLEFGFYIILADNKEIDNVKTFVKEFYSCIYCISENVDYHCSNKSVCADCLNVDSEVMEYVEDSIFKGTFAKALLRKGFDVTSMGMNLQEIGIAAATYDQGSMDYRAITYDDCEIEPDEDYTSVHITGSDKEGFELEKINGSNKLFKEIDDLFSRIMADSF